ncbi:hypothetical protein FBY06_103344 [Pseudomonas sp. SJZ085]|uniref:hypothetical protein n=1 Tax=unclassified Pseudomonas TaxID=196821 RepID=UPI00119B8CF4|nr:MULTISPECIES: hypothetical protein [unclassified Pseudomonas]TWC24625.1 hypothetical protein FBX99_10231 [Pseudomonas sp. SJZ074]TWC41158.1 hypothetical protein FBY06_103344 [Pseudomonas sp. SJZ085]
MTTSQNTDSDIQAVDPVQIPGMISVVHPANPDGGLPLSLFANGLLTLRVDPWTQQSGGDNARILLGDSDVPVLNKTIDDSEKDSPFNMYLQGDLLSHGINKIRLSVLRINQTTPQTSVPLTVLLHRPRPGGEVSGPGDNPNLTLTLPADVIANGVDAATAAQGVSVKISYPYMRADDVITLDRDSQETRHTVTAFEASVGNVDIILRTADFWQDNPRFALQYRVMDLLGNTSGPQAIWSRTTYIDVHVRQPALDLIRPKVLEARELNGERLNFEIDFYYADFATVEVNYTGSARDQQVKVYWIGRNSTYGSEIQTVSQAGQTLTFQIPRNEVVDCIGTGAAVMYTVRLPGTITDLPSARLNLTVTAQKHRLPEPTLDSSKTNLRAYHPMFSTAHSARVALFGVTVRYGQEIPITPNTSQTDLRVDPAWISENRGRPIMINWTLRETGTGTPIVFSWFLRLTA